MRYGLLFLLAAVLLFPEVLGTLAFSEITADRDANIELTDKDGEDGGILEINSEEEIEEGTDDQHLVTLTNNLNENQNVTVELDDNPGWEFSSAEDTVRTVNPIESEGGSADFSVDTDDDVGVDEGDYEIISQSGSFIFSQERSVSFVEPDDQDITLEIDGQTDDLVLESGEEVAAEVTDNDGSDVTADADISSDDENVVSIEDATVTAENEGESTVTAEYEGEEDTVEVTVEEDIEPPDFTVDITDVSTPVEEGEDVTITADLENEGDEEDTQNVELDIEGLGSTTEEITLGGSDSTTEDFDVETDIGDEGEYTGTISTDDDSDSTDEDEIIVEEAELDSDFLVEITDTNSPVDEGDTLEVTADIENDGEDSDEQTVELDADALGTDSDEIELGSGDSTTETFSVEANEPGEYTVEVSSNDDEDEEDIEVDGLESDFVVEDIDANTPVEGEALEVSADILNEDDGTDEQTITLDVDELGDAEDTVELDGNEEGVVEFEIETEDSDEGEYDAVVTTEDENSLDETVEVLSRLGQAPECDGYWDDETEPYSIEDVHDLQCISEEPDADYQLSEDIDASYTDDWNDGDGFEPIGADTPFEGTLDGDDHVIDTLFIDRDTEDDVGLVGNLDGGNIENLGLNEISMSGNDNVGGLVGLKDDGTISRTFVTGEVAGDENVGGSIGEAPDSNDDDVEDSYSHASVTGDTTVGGFIGSGDGGGNRQWGEIYSTGEVSGSTDGSTDVGGVIGEEDTGGGDGLTDNAYWDEENSGQTDSDGGGTPLTTDEMTGDDASDNMDGFDFGTWSVGDEDEYIELTGLERPSEPNFVVDIVDTNSPIEEGDTLEITSEIENVGDEEGEQEIEVDGDGLGEDSFTINLDEDESTTETFEIETETGDEGEYDAEVRSEDTFDTEPVEVVDEIAPHFDVTITGTNSAVGEGETLEVNAEIENTGTESDTQDIELDIDGLGEDDTTVDLDADEVSEETFEVDTDEGDIGEYEAIVASDDDSDEESVSVEEDPAEFEVEITDTNSPVAESDELEVDAVIENSGGQEDTQEIELYVDGIGEDSIDVTLEPQSSTSETLTIETEDGDEGTYDATIESDDDSDTLDIEIFDPSPVIEELDVSDDGGGNPSIIVDWVVSDIEGELDNLELILFDEGGNEIDTIDEPVSGDEDEDETEFDINFRQEDPDFVEATLTDTDGNEDTDTEDYDG